jgi:hypothetical protein
VILMLFWIKEILWTVLVCIKDWYINATEHSNIILFTHWYWRPESTGNSSHELSVTLLKT